MLAQFGVEFINEFLLHEFIVVPDMQDDHPLFHEHFVVLQPHPIHVGFLHGKDEIGPADQTFRHRYASLGLGSG